MAQPRVTFLTLLDPRVPTNPTVPFLEALWSLKTQRLPYRPLAAGREVLSWEENKKGGSLDMVKREKMIIDSVLKPLTGLMINNQIIFSMADIRCIQ